MILDYAVHVWIEEGGTRCSVLAQILEPDFWRAYFDFACEQQDTIS